MLLRVGWEDFARLARVFKVTAIHENYSCMLNSISLLLLATYSGRLEILLWLWISWLPIQDIFSQLEIDLEVEMNHISLRVVLYGHRILDILPDTHSKKKSWDSLSFPDFSGSVSGMSKHHFSFSNSNLFWNANCSVFGRAWSTYKLTSPLDYGFLDIKRKTVVRPSSLSHFEKLFSCRSFMWYKCFWESPDMFKIDDFLLAESLGTNNF